MLEKYSLTFYLISYSLLICNLGISQNNSLNQINNKAHDKFYIFGGWNKAVYSKSDIHFTGTNYDFTLKKVIADDRQSPFNPKIYFNPTKLTIPQYNFRVGYFINEKYNISIGVDHMKYVVRQYQSVLINGSIALSGTEYDKNYSHEEIIIQKGFLQLEHTDGLNNVNADFRRLDELLSWKFISINITEGAGVGFLVPRTDASLLNFDGNDKFHIAGYGLNAMLGLNIRFGKNFFIQSEYKMGYISMPDIRTSKYKEDIASQSFLFHQYNVVFGSHFRL